MKRTAEENLTAGAKTFAERAAMYGHSYTKFGLVMEDLFPKGLHIKAGDVDSYNRLGIFTQIITKCCRYAETLTEGGHEDSAHDIMVYGAILEELTEQVRGLQDQPGKE